MRYTNKSFSVNVGGGVYAKGWERIFGKEKPVCGECGCDKKKHTDTGNICIEPMCSCTGFRPKED